ncbi:ABC transporter ATP-binding protein [Phytoactinopolyspora limicola]|uniref:dipeptide ABC transporter ATP-binding protein n=1 Tax=Phytoactinopolyspora limicola TaxID=2715536 RepID=UPI00140B191A|nr:ABC transporter ATP-binding protein [Phytoactinopolyspora limicola]
MTSAHAAAPANVTGAACVPEPRESALLSVSDLRVSFTKPRSAHSTEVVAGLSMSVPAGGSVAIVGESGSGKTVSMRAMLGVLPDTAHVTGEALFEGRNLVGMPEPDLRRIRGTGIGMIFQNAMSALNPTRTLKVQLTEHLRWHGIASGAEARRRAVDALDRVGIPDPERRIRMYPFQLSGGQRQRAMIAMAIVAGPKLLIADEPTTALDVTVQRQVLDLLQDLRRDGLAIVMITHDLGVARYLCDDIVVMRHGQVVENASMRSFISAAQHGYSQHLLDTALDVTTAVGENDIDDDPVEDVTATTALAHPSPGVGGDQAELLVVRDLAKVFHGRGGDVTAVTDLSLTIPRGETIGVIGESGSGKSTLARLITRLTEPTAGDITFGGTDVLRLSGKRLKAWRRQVQMVFQNPYGSLLPHQTVAANVVEPLRVHKVGTKAWRRERALELLTMVGIPESRADQYPRQFSGGQQQRVAIARALALEPALLVCDEPTSALDVSIQAQVLELLQDLKERLGLSMLFITHNLAVAQRLCDRAIVMANGCVVEVASTDTLFTRPQHPYTQALLAAVLPIRAELPPRSGVTAALDRVPVEQEGDLVEITAGHWVRTKRSADDFAKPQVLTQKGLTQA